MQVKLFRSAVFFGIGKPRLPGLWLPLVSCSLEYSFYLLESIQRGARERRRKQIKTAIKVVSKRGVIKKGRICFF